MAVPGSAQSEATAALRGIRGIAIRRTSAKFCLGFVAGRAWGYTFP